MIDQRAAPYAATLLRVSLGAMFIAHSLVLKHFTFTLAGTAQFFAAHGFPGWSAYPVFALELIGDWIKRGILTLSPTGFEVRPGEAKSRDTGSDQRNQGYSRDA